MNGTFSITTNGALPYNKNGPSVTLQRTAGTPIPADILLELVGPKRTAGFGRCRVFAYMAMPEIAGNQHDLSLACDDKVRFAGQPSDVGLGAITQSAEQSLNRKLGSGPNALYCAHHLASLGWGDTVGHVCRVCHV